MMLSSVPNIRSIVESHLLQRLPITASCFIARRTDSKNPTTCRRRLAASANLLISWPVLMVAKNLEKYCSQLRCRWNRSRSAITGPDGADSLSLPSATMKKQCPAASSHCGRLQTVLRLIVIKVSSIGCNLYLLAAGRVSDNYDF